MAAVSRDRDGARLEQELETEEYRELLECLQRGEPFLRRFGRWGEVIAFMREGTSEDPRKDEILRPILLAHGADHDHRWRAILLVIFWPGLMSIQRKTHYLDKDDPDELWLRIYWEFHQSVCRINLERRSDRLVQWIFNSTISRLRESYRRDRKHAARETTTAPERIPLMAGTTEGIDLDAMELREQCQRQINQLREHFEAGRISEADFLLLVGTRLYGQTIGEHARCAGITREAAKKRRQRAEAAIRRYETGMR
ncbi:MAG: hypothetical protein JXB46_09990 [Candidatus Eisenbacteria bacterium]|nr:hypothetical protein [Candidatus Eisenbacteria bacterium]